MFCYYPKDIMFQHEVIADIADFHPERPSKQHSLDDAKFTCTLILKEFSRESMIHQIQMLYCSKMFCSFSSYVSKVCIAEKEYNLLNDILKKGQNNFQLFLNNTI